MQWFTFCGTSPLKLTIGWSETQLCFHLIQTNSQSWWWKHGKWWTTALPSMTKSNLYCYQNHLNVSLCIIIINTKAGKLWKKCITSFICCVFWHYKKWMNLDQFEYKFSIRINPSSDWSKPKYQSESFLGLNRIKPDRVFNGFHQRRYKISFGLVR